MRKFIFLVSVLALLLGLATTAWGFDVPAAKTEAQILVHPPDPITPVIQLNFKAQLVNDGFGDLASADVLIGWEKFGGIQPTPFKILIPAGCFIPDSSFHVDDFRGCGIQVTYDDGRGPVALSIMDFDARFKTRRNGTARFTMEASFTDAGRESAILGALGATAVEIAIGAEMGTALTRKIELVSGIEPTPF